MSHGLRPCPETPAARSRAVILITAEQRAALTAQALAAPPPTAEQRRRLRPLLAGTLAVAPLAVAS